MKWWNTRVTKIVFVLIAIALVLQIHALLSSKLILSIILAV
jgi:hypothetical protein